MPAKLTLQPNIPQCVALRFPTGKIVTSRFGDEKQVFFSLVDGRSAFVSLGVGQSINNLRLGDEEKFWICKRWNGEARQQPRFDVWLTPEGEKLRAQKEANPQPVQQPLPVRKAPVSEAGSLPTLGTGTNGPVAMPAPAPVAVPGLQAWGQSLFEADERFD